MKHPVTKLPWKVDGNDELWNDVSPLLNGWDDGSAFFCDRQDSEYCVQACNNFPEAVELLREYLEDIPSSGMSDLERRTEKFLKSLEDE